MLFNSWVFLYFFSVTLAAAWLAPSWRARKLVLVAASLLFYAWWHPPLLLLLLTAKGTAYVVARRLEATAHPGHRRAWLAAGLTVLFGLLAYFKYAGFVAENLAGLFGALGVDWAERFRHVKVLLPLGVSFFVLQASSYLLDVFRGQIRPVKRLVDFALYVAFFPQLVAGPIVRAGDFLWQCLRPQRVTHAQVAWGLALVAWGLAKKMVFADLLAAPVVNRVFAQPQPLAPLEAWAGAYGFAVQIYCDFSGYSDIAVGLAQLLGFRLPDNFHRPYGAVSFRDFWRRWHISLSTWLRDYLYIPLGGNRLGRLRTSVNVLVTMLLGGLWHGAAWTFVAWGALHGAFLMVEHWWATRPSARRWQVPDWLCAVLVFHLTCVSWVLFRAPSFHAASAMLRAMFSPGWPPAGAGRPDASLLLVIAAAWGLVAWHVVNRQRSLAEVTARLPGWALGVCTAGLLLLCRVLGTGGHAFIYFQF